MKGVFIWLAVMITAILVLSFFANVPYIYTILGISAWVSIGHLVTLDDDMPGGWSNPENSANIWRSSKLELLIKFSVSLGILTIMSMFPSITEYGS